MTTRSSTALPVFSHLGLAPSIAHPTSRPRSIEPYAFSGLQIALAALFLFAGGGKFAMSAEDLTKDTALSAAFLRFIGACEVVGAIGLVASALGRGWRVLTPLAAVGLTIIMIGTVTVTAIEMSVPAALFPLAIGLLLSLLIYARRDWFESFATLRLQ